MHGSDPVSLPDVDHGLHLVRWKVSGFDEMRRLELLDRKAQFELVDGLILHRDAGSPRHDRVVAELTRRLETAYRSSADVAVAEEVRFDDLDAVVVPDVVVRSGSAPPSLIVEVTDEAPRLEAQEKARLYARAGVEEYWHTDLAWQILWVHAHPHDDQYGMRSCGPSNRASLTHVPGLEDIVLDELLAAADAAA